MGKYFGTDGFRGRAGRDLTAVHAFKTGRFLGDWYRKKNGDRPARIVIGKDTRKSSYMFENALASGITSSGSDAYLLHVTTTPCVSYITRSEHFDCGIMISASHNPFYDNGIKLLNSDGEKMDDDTIEALESYLDGKADEIPFMVDEKIGSTIDFYTGRNRYIGYLTTIPTRSFEHKRVGLDCANGASWMIARSVFDALGAKSYVIHAEPDGTNINRQCGSTHLDDLKRYVRENSFDVGFAFDGDADRCLAVDELGNEVNGDKIMYIIAKWMKKHDMLPKNTVVTTVMSNFGLYKALDDLEILYEKTAVGDRYVYENMKQNDYFLGGEQSGHIIFRKYACTGDGLVTAILLMSVMEETNLPLSVLAEGCDMYPQILKNVEVDDKAATMADERVRETVKVCEDSLGVRGRVLLRPSGTEPVLRVMAEALTEKECEENVDRIIDSMRCSGHLRKVR
ncbi:MAG: phosphoglucosamine mutase [Lachnospiraceae bacterium]|nr:phosphoglucosamine mutase [Lachnospiraceae bacterium]